MCIYNIVNHSKNIQMKKKDKSLEVIEYRIKFYYTDSPQIVHKRYLQSISYSQMQKSLNKIIDDGEYMIISIEQHNRFTKKWEIAKEANE